MGAEVRRRPSVRPILTAASLCCCLALGCTASTSSEEPGQLPQPTAATQSASEARPAKPDLTASDYAAIQRELTRGLAAGDPQLGAVRSVLVDVGGRTVISYHHGRKLADHANVWSVTKSVMSILVGIAVDEGRLTLDQTLRELLPDQASNMSEQQASVTLRQLLTMTAGFSGDQAASNPSADDTVAQILDYGLSNDPGEVFEYSNASAHLVAAVLRRAVDRPVLSYAREKLFGPLGIDTRPAWQGWDTFSPGSGFHGPGFGWQTDKAGTNVGAAGLKLSPPDMLKLGRLYLNGGLWDGHRVVSEVWVRQSTSSQLTAKQEELAATGYGFFWWVGRYQGLVVFSARGSYYQRIVCFPEIDAVFVATAADDAVPDGDLDPLLDPILGKVLDKLLSLPR
jgi:CubicO group peptidase (beta-lactamase class C family)